MTWKIFWDAATAFGTVAMSLLTYAVIRQNRDQRRDDAHPILTLMPFDGVDPANRSDLLSPRSNITPRLKEYSFIVNCVLINAGVGPALDIKIDLRFMARKNYGQIRELAPLAAGSSRGDAQHPIMLPVTLTDSFKDVDFSTACGTGWVIVLEYKDVFGNVFHTTHARSLQIPWFVHGKGHAPERFSEVL